MKIPIWAGKTRHVTCSDSRIVARLLNGEGMRFLYVVNTARENIHTTLILSPTWGSVTQLRILFGNSRPVLQDGIRTAAVPARDGLVLELIK